MSDDSANESSTTNLRLPGVTVPAPATSASEGAAATTADSGSGGDVGSESSDDATTAAPSTDGKMVRASLDECLVCTGHKELDCLFEDADMASVLGLDQSKSVYTWQGYCDALKVARDMDTLMYEGDSLQEAAANHASLLSHCYWESGQWKHCDETNWNKQYTPEEASCSQRPGGADRVMYHTLTGSPDACPIDPAMVVSANTNDDTKCEGEGSTTESCCWWGRGAIQTTGPSNIGLLNKNVVKPAAEQELLPELKGVDLCKDPQAICKPEYPSLKWVGGIYYWVSMVQTVSTQKDGTVISTDPAKFKAALKKFVDDEFETVEGGFNGGAGGVINNGNWSTNAHGHTSRDEVFGNVMAALQLAGLEKTGETSDSAVPFGCDSGFLKEDGKCAPACLSEETSGYDMSDCLGTKLYTGDIRDTQTLKTKAQCGIKCSYGFHGTAAATCAAPGGKFTIEGCVADSCEDVDGVGTPYVCPAPSWNAMAQATGDCQGNCNEKCCTSACTGVTTATGGGVEWNPPAVMREGGQTNPGDGEEDTESGGSRPDFFFMNVPDYLMHGMYVGSKTWPMGETWDWSISYTNPVTLYIWVAHHDYPAGAPAVLEAAGWAKQPETDFKRSTGTSFHVYKKDFDEGSETTIAGLEGLLVGGVVSQCK